MSSDHFTFVLEKKDIARIVDSIGLDGLMDQTIAVLTDKMACWKEEGFSMKARDYFMYNKPDFGLMEWMPGHMEGDRVVMKMVGEHPENPNKNNMPTIMAAISHYDCKSGHMSFLCEGVFATALRTGAASAVASRVMAAPDSEVLGIVGCGAQNVTQAHALSRVFDLKKILCYDIDAPSAESFAQRVAFLNIPVEVVSLADVERESDILCTSTTTTPEEGAVIRAENLKPHLHINAVGADYPGKHEIPLVHLRRSFVVPDFPEQAYVEGECQFLKSDEIGPEIAEILQNPDKYADKKNGFTVYDSTGQPLQDFYVSDLLKAHAEKMGLGQKLVLDGAAQDVKNPYLLEEKKKEDFAGKDTEERDGKTASFILQETIH